jgi:hypothetical protein
MRAVKTHVSSQRAAGIALALVLCAVLLLPSLTPPSNCGGNSAALAACSHIGLCFSNISEKRGNQPVSIVELSAAERASFEFVLSDLSWIPNSKVFVTRSAIQVDSSNGKRIICVCHTPFDNVPQRWIGKAPLTHAVGYGDGSAGLLSVEEFQRLDLSDFVDVSSIQKGKTAIDQ